MSKISALRHFETFARLRTATAADMAEIARLEDLVGSFAAPFDWTQASRRSDVTIILAHEADSIVGAIAFAHAAGAAAATLLCLMVFPDARHRGIGSILLAAAVDGAINTGASVLVADIPESDLAMRRLLVGLGFQLCDASVAGIRYKLSLRRHKSEASNVVQFAGRV